jgi:Protein of unknown function (DUF4236)
MSSEGRTVGSRYCKIPPVGWRFQRRRSLLPGLTLNVGKRGGSISLGKRGGRLNVGRRGLTATASLLGTGLSYVRRLGRR